MDLLCRGVDLNKPVGEGVLYEVDPIEIVPGGITSNSGVTLARLGASVGIFSYVGRDRWGPIIRSLYEDEGINTDGLIEHPSGATSTTVVMVSPDGERSFYHCVGAPKLMDAALYREHMSVFANARMMLLGYYSLMPNLEPDLADVLAEIRSHGCMTALDAAGTGGTMDPLEKLLPQLDVYVPSRAEAVHQTGLDDPRKIIEAYRACGAPGVVGVKLGSDGVMLSRESGHIIEVPICPPPGDVVDTTGAGDCFYAGLLAGLLRGMDLADAGRLGTAAASCAITAVGGSAGGRDYDFTAQLAGLSS